MYAKLAPVQSPVFVAATCGATRSAGPSHGRRDRSFQRRRLDQACVIGTNKKDAADTVARILEDRDADRLNQPADTDRDAVADSLAARVPGLVTWRGWSAIDTYERSAGDPQGCPRVKISASPA